MRVPIGFFAILFATTACGDSGGSTASEQGGNPPPPPPGASVQGVTIQDYTFSPATFTIKAGTAVKWTNNGPSAHTATSDDGAWNSGQLGAPGPADPNDPYGGGGTPGGTYQFTFTAPGTYPYHCANHPPASFPAFVGTITVTQ